MNNRFCNEATLKNICEYGRYYYPATSHYESGTAVQCDRCNDQNLKSCIGWKEYDLCLTCADVVAQRMTRKSSDDDELIFRTFMVQNQFNIV